MQAKFLTPTQFAVRVGVRRQRVLQWLGEDRIPGARRITDAAGRTVAWEIPANARRPKPLRPGPEPAKTAEK